MSDLETLQQLRAWNAGRAIPTAETLPWPRVATDDTRILAFVRMAGEATPWGFAIGAPGSEPQIVTVADPRDQSATAALCADLSDALLPHVGHPSFGAASDAARTQLWVPGVTHLDALHLLALRFGRARHGAREDIIALRRLARAAGYLFRESRRPGQIRVFDASAALRACFAFPSQPIRQQHLGYLLAWLRASHEESHANRTSAAELAESEAISWTLDPALEESQLEPLLAAHTRARHEQRPTDELADAIHEVLEKELTRRWKLCEEAWLLLNHDPRKSNPFVPSLEPIARDEHAWQYLHIEQKLESVDETSDDPGVFVPHAETDHSPAAASNRYWSAVRCADIAAELVHGDRWLLAKSVAEGTAIDAIVTSVRAVKRGRAVDIYWTIRCSNALPTKFREGADLALHGLPKRTATVLSIDERDDERVIELEITGWKNARVEEGVPAAFDHSAYEGSRVAFVAPTMPELALRKAAQSWKSDGPGAWLTHARSRPVAAASPSGATGRSLLDLVDRQR